MVANSREGNAAGIVSLAKPGAGGHAGMGMLVTPHHVLTCAHVVNLALGRSIETAEQPNGGATCLLQFPLLENPLHVKAHVIRWVAPGSARDDDMALLELEQVAPVEAGLARIAIVTGVSLVNDDVSSYGIPPGSSTGRHVTACLAGQATDAWHQLAGKNGPANFIQPGFSGAAVWDGEHSAVVGMVVRREYLRDDLTSYLMPASALQAFWPDLPVELRNQGPRFNMSWTALAGLFFALLLIQWQAAVGADLFKAIALYGDRKLLAPFAGMHMFAVLAPIVFWVMFRFAGSRALQPWFARLPAFGSTGRIAQTTTRPSTAIGTLVAFVLLPIAAQFFFLVRVHSGGGKVYAANSNFLLDGAPIQALGGVCQKGWCTWSGLDLYTLAPAQPHAPGGYIDDAYRFGEIPDTTTFFPIFQPVAIEALSLVALFLAARLCHRLLRDAFNSPLRSSFSARKGDRP